MALRPPKAPKDGTIRIPLLTEQDIIGKVDGEGNVRFTGIGLRVVQDLVRRTGGQTTDAVATANATANTAQATASANSAGVTVPTPGGAVELDPVNPLSAESNTITVASHTRTGAGAAIIGGSIAVSTRGLTYYVWYADPTDAGGAVTFVAAEDLTTFTANDRLIGSIFVPTRSATSGLDTDIVP